MIKNKYLRIVKKNYLLFALLTIVFFVFLFLAYNTVFSRPEYVYVKVKLGQGYWWASTTKANLWYIDSLKKGIKSYDISGNENAQIISTRYYATASGYDAYIVVKLRAKLNKEKNEYTYNRYKLSVASPIDLDFPTVFISGTVIALGKNPFNEKEVEKIVYLVNPGGYSDNSPEKFNSIKIGDKYFNGENYSFEILDKYLRPSSLLFQDYLSFQTEGTLGSKDIVVKAKVRAKEKNNQLIYGEEYRLAENAQFSLYLSNYYFDRFFIEKIE